VPSELTSASEVVRDAIPFSRVPWIRPLAGAQAQHYDAVASLFAGNPADPAAWRDTIQRVQHANIDRTLTRDVLVAQTTERRAPQAARDAAATLANATTVAVVTGQQAGLFGGPLYTLLKAVTTIQLARQVSAAHGVTAVPIFWVESEDHDFDEIRSATVLDRDFSVSTLTLGDLPGAGTRPVASLQLDERVTDVIAALDATLATTEFTPALLDGLRRQYQPGRSLSAAFAGWLDDLLGAEGLVVFDASDRRAKPAVARLFAEEISSPCRTSALARAAGEAMRALGHAPQIEPGDDVVCLFYLDETTRRPIRYRDGQFFVGDERREAADLASEAAAHPERFSPNVLLRPLVQDTLFPTVCYVAGPSELAYQAQLGEVYRTAGLPQPLLASRASATVLDSAAAKFLDRHDLPLDALQGQDDTTLNRLLEGQLPPQLESTFADLDRLAADGTLRLKPLVASVDPTLTGAVDTTLERLRDTLKSLQGKILQAAKKKDDTLRRQFARTRTLTFPSGQPQERVLNVVFFVNRYGPGFVARLIDVLPPLAGAHLVITP
jgi:bacillithiol biosynthesis cysteine-adding enzyme BshC